MLSNEHSQTRSAGTGLRQTLDLAHAHVCGEPFAFRDAAFSSGSPALLCSSNDARSEILERRETQAVPPTVMRSSLMVGMPTPTGTLCPSLPQMPMPSSNFRSLPTIDTYLSASGPLPTSVAPRTGVVILPSSIR